MASLQDYERKRSRGKTPEPFGARRGQGADLRRPAPRRAAAPLRLPPRAGRRARQLGRAEGRSARARQAAPGRPCRGPPALVRDLRGRDPGRELRRRHGRDLGSRHLRAPRGEAQRRSDRAAAWRAARRGRGRSSPRSSPATRRTGCCSKKEPEARRRGESAPLHADAGDARGASRAARAGCRGEMGRLSRDCDHPRRRRDLRSRNGNADRPLPTSAARSSSSSGRPTASSTARSSRVDENGRASFSAMQQGRGTLLTWFDVLEVEGEPLIDLPLTERRARLAELIDRRCAASLSQAFDDGEALLGPRGAGLRGRRRPSAPTRATSRAGARATG